MRRFLGMVASAAVLVAACGSAPSPTDAVSDAPAKTAEAQTAKVSEIIEITPSPDAATSPATPTTFTAEGVMDFANRRAQITAVVGDQSIGIVTDGATIYEHLPALAAEMGGKEWFKLDADTVGEMAGIQGLGSLAQSQPNDPAGALDYLRGASGTIKEVGEETVRGVDTTRYRATIDMAKLAAAVSPDAAATVTQISETFGIATIPMEAWIDDEGRARRISQTIDYTGAKPTVDIPAGSFPSRMELTLEFFDFGTPVSIAVPPAEQVADFSELLPDPGAGSGAGGSGTAGSGTAGSGTETPETLLVEPRLITDVPSDYLRQPDNVGDTGPSDLEKAVRDEGGGDEGEDDPRSVLVGNGFVAGYQRLWANESEAQIIDFVYEFSEPSGAIHHMSRTVDSVLEDAQGFSVFSVPGVPGAMGVRGMDPDGVPAAAVFLYRGPYEAQVVVTGPDADGTLPLELASHQYDQLS